MKHIYRGILLNRYISIHFCWIGIWRHFDSGHISEIHLGFVRIQYGPGLPPYSQMGTPPSPDEWSDGAEKSLANKWDAYATRHLDGG